MRDIVPLFIPSFLRYRFPAPYSSPYPVHPTPARYPSLSQPLFISTLIDRLQRHFTVFAISNPDIDALKTIYSSIFMAHLEIGDFHPMIKRYGINIVEASLELHKKVASTFLPTAIKFHYNFNLRDLSNIYQVSVGLSVCLNALDQLPLIIKKWTFLFEMQSKVVVTKCTWCWCTWQILTIT